MTAQMGERLRYQGQEVSMFTEPLSNYFARIGGRPRFLCRVTSLLRGYLGTWEIADERLYLVELRGVFEDDTPFSVATFFPDRPDRVFADWYSGTLRIPQGKQLQYVHMGYHSTYERDLLVEIDQGVVVGTRVHQNGSDGS